MQPSVPTNMIYISCKYLFRARCKINKDYIFEKLKMKATYWRLYYVLLSHIDHIYNLNKNATSSEARGILQRRVLLRMVMEIKSLRTVH